MTPEVKERIAQIRRGEVPEGYKKRKRYIFPVSWNGMTLGNICSKIGSGKTPKGGEKTYTISGIPFIRSQNVLNGTMDISEIKHIDTSTFREMAGSAVYKNDILLNITGASIGRCCIVKDELCPANVNQHVCIIRFDEKQANRQFVMNCLLSEQLGQFQINSYQAGGNREGLNFQQVSKIWMPCPPIPEQQRIASILSTQDKVIELKEKLLEEKKQQKKYLMQQLLTGKKRLPGFSGEWKEVRLNQFLKERKEENIEQKLRICSVAVKEGVVDQIEHLGRSFAAKNTSNYGVAYNGDIIYTKSPTGDFPYGIIKQNHLKERVAISPLYGIYKPVSFALGYILHTYFSNPINTRNYLYPIVQKGAKNTINITNKVFISNTLYLPLSLSEQEAIAEVFSTADHEIELLQKSIEAEKQKKKALMQLLLTGIVRVQV